MKKARVMFHAAVPEHACCKEPSLFTQASLAAPVKSVSPLQFQFQQELQSMFVAAASWITNMVVGQQLLEDNPVGCEGTMFGQDLGSAFSFRLA